MLSILDIIKKLTRGLYPEGRAFQASLDGIREKFHAALAASESRAYAAALSTLDSSIADNENFTADDAGDWERRLGLVSADGASLANRMAVINQKLNYPQSNAPRQHHLYIQEQLQAAGFNVHIYENNFAGVTKTPQQILSPALPNGSVHSIGTHHGPNRHGPITFHHNKIVNYIDESRDAHFIIGANYRSTFFVSGATLTTFANIPAARKIEFRQLLLRLKPVQAVGFLFVNYI